MKGVLFCIALLAAIFLLGSHADAVTEYCPASVSVGPPGSPIPGDAAPAPSSSYGIALTATSARSVQGTVAFRTDSGWYTVDFPVTKLDADVDMYQAGNQSFQRTSYRSDVLYVDFPKQVSILSAFLSSAKTTGESTYGWDAKGSVACAGQADWKPAPARVLHLMNPKRVLYVPPGINGSGVLHAVAAAAPGSTDCPIPFADASTVRVARGQYPAGARYSAVSSGDVYVAIAISETGSIDDAWVWGPSGNPLLDNEAVRVAKATTYAPARSFCKNAPGIYLFRDHFSYE